MNDLSEKMVVGYLLLNRIKIDDANTISGPLTYGFPAITGFTGAVHALSRKIMADSRFGHLSLGGVLVACYDCQPKVYRVNRYRDCTFIQTRNPLKKDGGTAAIVEEGKCNLQVSLVVEVCSDDELCEDTIKELTQFISQAIFQQRIAGGSVMAMATTNPVQYFGFEKLCNMAPMFMPAFVLMDASDEFADLIAKSQDKDPSTTPLDVFLDVCTLHHIPKVDENNGTQWHTQSVKTGYGWLVPMPMGYQAISKQFDSGKMANVRNPEYCSQYVEAVYGLGKWVYPHHLTNCMQTAFWRQTYDENGLYLLTQNSELSF